MKRLALLLLLSVGSMAQAATRPVVLTWTASPSASVTGYNLYRCTVPSGASTCTPVASGTPLNGSTPVSGVTYTDNPATSASYGYGIVAVAPPCSAASLPTVACGNAPIDLSPIVPVPPAPAGGGTVIIIVP